MAIRLEIGKTDDEKRLGDIIEILKQRTSTNAELDRITKTLEKIYDGKTEPPIKPLSLYMDAWDAIREEHIKPTDYKIALENAEKIYNEIMVNGANTPQFEERAAIYQSLIKTPGVLMHSSFGKAFFDFNLFASFADKNNYLSLMYAVQRLSAKDALPSLSSYGLNIREYIIDDYGYLANLLMMVKKLAAANSESYDEIVKEGIRKVERAGGVYDISPERLSILESKLSAAEAVVESGKELFDGIDLKCRDIEVLAENFSESTKRIARMTEDTLNTKSANAKSEVELAIKEFVAGQKKTILMDKDALLKEVFKDAEAELNRYKALAEGLSANAQSEMALLSRDADAVLTRVSKTLNNDDKIKEFLAKAKVEDEILDKIEKLSVLNGSGIERMIQQPMSGMAPMPPMPHDGGFMPHEGAPGMMPPPHRHARRDEPIAPVNPLLDRSIPFADRFARVMAEKERRMAKGELFHEMFDDVITAVMEDVNPYLIGPSGCGKTYMVMQIGQILNLNCDDIGYINEEYDILGYVTATGEYSESNFYRLYKYGGIAFCDELDNGNSKATVKLNSFLTNKIDSSYSFPGGERVQRHPNFRVIAAGNTDGSGADVNYSTREKIEESVQQRMIPVYIDYDNRVEKEILKDYPEWYEFVCAFRLATDKWSEVCGIPASGIFTTRDAYRIKTYLDNGSFSLDKIITYEFVQTKDPEYLGFIVEDMGKRIDKKFDTQKLLNIFVSKVEEVRSKGRKY